MRIENNPKTRIIWDSAIEEVIGTGEPKIVSGVRVRNLPLTRDNLVAAMEDD